MSIFTPLLKKADALFVKVDALFKKNIRKMRGKNRNGICLHKAKKGYDAGKERNKNGVFLSGGRLIPIYRGMKGER
ncbi:MAG: hypothetical protein LUG18_14570 [Candidatus Azobacteroides sp.]|nr:hypothetical protein [Candidatus Azobacteroides sp.]